MSEDFEVAEVPQQEVTAEDSLEGVAQPEPVEVEPVQGVRRGRKPDRQVRVQVSAYLDKETYEGIKIASSSTGLTVSDILAKAAFFFVRDNAEEIESYRQFTKGQHWKFGNGR